jgi:hypothetical protein
MATGILVLNLAKILRSDSAIQFSRPNMSVFSLQKCGWLTHNQQCCQMAYLQTNVGKFWKVFQERCWCILLHFGLFYGLLEYSMFIKYIFSLFDKLYPEKSRNPDNQGDKKIFRFGPLADFGKDRGDNFIRFTTVRKTYIPNSGGRLFAPRIVSLDCY